MISARKTAHARPDRVIEPHRIVFRLLASAGVLKKKDPRPDKSAIDEFDRLGMRQQALLLPHLELFLEGPRKDDMWRRERASAEAGQSGGDRKNRAWKFFQPVPIDPRVRSVQPRSTTPAERFAALGEHGDLRRGGGVLRLGTAAARSRARRARVRGRSRGRCRRRGQRPRTAFPGRAPANEGQASFRHRGQLRLALPARDSPVRSMRCSAVTRPGTWPIRQKGMRGRPPPPEYGRSTGTRSLRFTGKAESPPNESPGSSGTGSASPGTAGAMGRCTTTRISFSLSSAC